MEMHFDDLLGKITNFINSTAKTETIVGAPVQMGEYSCVPVIKISMGFGSGGGEHTDSKNTKHEGGGAGAGIYITPIGFLASRGSDIVFISTDKAKGLNAIYEKVPDLVEKVVDQIASAKNKKNKDTSSGEIPQT